MQEAQKNPKQWETKEVHIETLQLKCQKNFKNKESILKPSRQKQLGKNRELPRPGTDFPSATWQARSESESEAAQS